MTVKTFRKIQMIVKAIQFDGTNGKEIATWLHDTYEVVGHHTLLITELPLPVASLHEYTSPDVSFKELHKNGWVIRTSDNETLIMSDYDFVHTFEEIKGD